MTQEGRDAEAGTVSRTGFAGTSQCPGFSGAASLDSAGRWCCAEQFTSNRCPHTEGRMAPAAVVQDLDVLEDGGANILRDQPCLTRGAPPRRARCSS